MFHRHTRHTVIHQRTSKPRQKAHGLILAIFLLTSSAVGFSLSIYGDEPAILKTTVKQLQEQGWVITSSTNYNETHPGLPPYENLTRVLSITNYVLTRQGKTVNCEIIYDSQRDNFEESCADNGS